MGPPGSQRSFWVLTFLCKMRERVGTFQVMLQVSSMWWWLTFRPDFRLTLDLCWLYIYIGMSVCLLGYMYAWKQLEKDGEEINAVSCRWWPREAFPVEEQSHFPGDAWLLKARPPHPPAPPPPTTLHSWILLTTLSVTRQSRRKHYPLASPSCDWGTSFPPKNLFIFILL